MSCSARLSGLHWASLRILRSRTMTVSSLDSSLIRGIASSSSSDESEEDVVVGKIREEESRLVPSGGSVAARGQKDTASETYADSSGAVQVEDGERDHAARLNPGAFGLLQSESAVWQGKTAKKKVNQQKPAKQVSLWTHLQSYTRSAYAEKTVLLDPVLAKDVADAIAEKSERGPDTRVFMDADGGCCDVTRRLLERGVFPEAKVFVRDRKMKPLHDWALKETLYHVADRIDFKDLNLVQIVSDFLAAKGQHLSPLYEVTNSLSPSSSGSKKEDDPWLRKNPPYTLYGTVNHSFVKYLTSRCLQRDSLLNVFFEGRPEFFLVVSSRTMLHLTSDAARAVTFRPQNALFQLVFDYELVMSLPRTSFFPWRRPRSSSSPNGDTHRSMTRLYDRMDDKFYLLRMRPKADLGLTPPATAEHLDFFVNSVYRNKRTRLIPLLERWVPGSGLQLVRQGYHVYFTTNDLPLSEAIPVLNVLASRPDFSQSNFGPQAATFRRMSLEDHAADPKGTNGSENRRRKADTAVQRALEKLRREFRSGDQSGTRG